MRDPDFLDYRAVSLRLILALAGKVAAGVDAREIIAKELSLSGVQRPLDPKEFGDDAQEIFRLGDFAGWIIEPLWASVRLTPPAFRP